MKNLLKCSSLIRVVVIMVVMAFMASQMAEIYAKQNQGNKQIIDDLEQHDTGVNNNIVIHDGNMTKEHGDLGTTLDEINDKLDQCIGNGNGNGTDCDVCPPPEGVEKSWVPKTGSTINNNAGEDGDLQKGITWPNPRFTDNGDGTVTDNLTCLIWTQDADIADGTRTWSDALTDCNSLASGSQGLTDGSMAGDWRLPNVRELSSLIDFSQFNPSLPSGHPFMGVQQDSYWSSTIFAVLALPSAWQVDFGNGSVDASLKDDSHFVWCVRGP